MNSVFCKTLQGAAKLHKAYETAERLGEFYDLADDNFRGSFSYVAERQLDAARNKWVKAKARHADLILAAPSWAELIEQDNGKE